uniref:Protein Shroom1 n=1 Tax=Geotrypetes seraphini TaxID=260995 RepID=A0A6P8Q7E9_GEOSA|nr:protein Shroom1 [Geotrypetes seraphini]XP_033783108.1 protein Shroom1 [Geotrypetes seraphini]
MKEYVLSSNQKKERLGAYLSSGIFKTRSLIMAAFGNDLESWNLKDAGSLTELLQPLDSVHYGSGLSPMKSISTIDHLLNLSGKADSAYSSFSGGSNFPDYHTPSFCNENCGLPSEQLPYMDSEYIKVIYNPSAIDFDLKDSSQPKLMDTGSQKSSNGIGFCGQNGNAPTHDFIHKSLLPLSPSQSLLPPSPPTRLDSYKVIRSFDSTRKDSDSWDPIIQNAIRSPPPHNNNIQSVISELKPYWNSRQKNERSPDEPNESDLSKTKERKSNRHIFTRSSFFNLQECFKSDSVAKTQKLHCAPDSVQDYRIPEEMNSKSFHPPPTSCDVKDIHENKKYLCSPNEHTQSLRGADPPGHLLESREPEVPLPISHRRIWSDKYATQDEDVTQDRKFSNSSFQNELVFDAKSSPPRRKTGSELLSRSSEEERRKDMQELSVTHRSKGQSSLQPHSLEVLKTGVDNDGKSDFRSKTQQIAYDGPKNDLASQFASVFSYEMKTNDSSRDFNMNQKQEVLVDLGPHETPQQEFHKSKNTPVCELASDKISKETTPMLYHLAGGRHTNMATILNCKNPPKPTKDSGNIPMKTQNSNQLLMEQSNEIQKTKPPPPKIKEFQQFTDKNFVNHSDDDRMLGGSISSLDDSFMKDYREKIKVAQKKVLRETSFKRKDLQMSLPIRLKPNPSKRPSIEHFRSFSANEDVRFIPPDDLWETSNKHEDSKKPLLSRIGGRKRVTKEQKKLCYSEPEKLDQLGMQQTLSSLSNLENTRVTSEENNGLGLLASRRSPFENREQARSTSTLSKTELKQIQHNAVLQYIERKISLKPTNAQQIPLAKPIQRPSTSMRHSERFSNSNGKRIPPNAEASALLQSSEKSPESFDNYEPWTERSSTGASVQSRNQPLVRETDQSKIGPCPYAENFHHSKDQTVYKGHKRSMSTPLAQGSSREAVCTGPAQNRKDQAAVPSGVPSEASIADGLFTAKLRAQPSTEKGKSIEETGISEMTRLPAFNQSADHLHHLKSQGLPPGPGYELGLKTILQSPENGSGSLLKHTTKDRAVELPAGTQRIIPTYEKPPPGKSCAEDAPPFLVPDLPPTHQPLSAMEGDEVSLNDVWSKPHSKSGETKYALPLPTLPVASEEVQSEKDQKTSLHDPVAAEGCHKDENKFGQAFWGGQSSESSPGVQPTFETTLLSSQEEVSRVNKLEKERTNLSVSKNGIRNLQEFVGVDNVTFSLSNVIDLPVTALAQSDQDKSKKTCGAQIVKSEKNNDNPGVSQKTTDLSQVKLTSDDQRSEELIHEIMAKDKSLVDMLEFHLIRKTALDLMAGLFPIDLPAVDRSSRMKKTQLVKEQEKDGAVEISSKSVTLPEKCQRWDTSQERSQELDDITAKKKELISNIQSKLQHLCAERELLLSDIRENASCGGELEAVVKAVCKPNEYERYLMYIGDLEKVAILLLCLSMRLARVQNAMSKMSDATDPEERQSLVQRHSLLSRQREDAKDLKENLDRRERLVAGILQRHLSEQQVQDHSQFVRQKTSFLIKHKDLEEQIKFHEEQLASLQKSIPR